MMMVTVMVVIMTPSAGVGTVWSTLHMLTHFIFKHPYEVGATIIPIS